MKHLQTKSRQKPQDRTTSMQVKRKEDQSCSYKVTQFWYIQILAEPLKYTEEVSECKKGRYRKKWGHFSSCNAEEMDFQDWLDREEKPMGLFCLRSMRHLRWERERGGDGVDGYRVLEMGRGRWALACRIWQSKFWKPEIPSKGKST